MCKRWQLNGIATNLSADGCGDTYEKFLAALLLRAVISEAKDDGEPLYLYEFNGRLTFVTVGHVDDLSYAYDTRCKTTKALLQAIVKEFNMSRKHDDFVFLWQTCFV